MGLDRVHAALLAGWLFVSCGSLPAGAVEVAGLYDVDVPMEERSAGAVAEAGSAALEVMLTRLTGLYELPEDNETLQAALDNPGDFYSRFVYPDPRTLRIFFDPDSVVALVERTGLPLWPANRPALVAWVVVQEGREREIVHDQHPLAEVLREHARSRGLPLTLPLMDLADRVEVDEGVVWGRMSSILRPASERYGADAILVGRLRRDGNTATESAPSVAAYTGEFDLWLDREEIELTLEQVDMVSAGEAAVDWVAGEFSSRFAVLGAEANRIDLVVEGIGRISDYAALLAYLDSLDYVSAYQVVAMAEDELMISLATRADAEQFLTLLGREGRLVAESPRVGGSVNPPGPPRVTWQVRGR